MRPLPVEAKGSFKADIVMTAAYGASLSEGSMACPVVTEVDGASPMFPDGLRTDAGGEPRLVPLTAGTPGSDAGAGGLGSDELP